MAVPKTLEHRYRPRGPAASIFRGDAARRPEVLLAGPAGTGKSRSCLEKMLACALRNDGMAGLIVRKTNVSLAATGLRTWERFVAKEAMASGECWFFGGSTRLPPAYRFQNGSSIAIGGLDKPEKIMSSEYDLIYAQEATELEVADWEACTSRLRNGVLSYQQLLADCNPSHPLHWLKQRCESGACTMLDTRHEDNPVYFDEIRAPGGLTEYKITERGRQYLDRLDKLTGVRYLRLRKGLWVAAEGVIYEDFDPRLHVIEPFAIPDSWTRYWVVDFGWNAPFVLQMWAVDGDGRAYLYRELYGTGRLVEDWARDALDLVSIADPSDPDSLRARIWREPKPRVVICDHDAEGRATLEKYLGRGTVPATKGVDDGIQSTQKRFRVAGDGRPRIFIFRDARANRADPALVDARKPTCTVEEIVAYVWDTGVVRALGASERTIKDIPLKKDDHGMDCMRYLAVELEKGRPRVRAG